jgi:NAD-dependent dihydropyrimidine dehydrogenase PreA subunit
VVSFLIVLLKNEGSKMKKPPEINIKEEWCKSCEICVQFCPKDVLKMGQFYPEVVNLEQCTGCKLCELLCPDFAIEVKTEKEKKEKVNL